MGFEKERMSDSNPTHLPKNQVLQLFGQRICYSGAVGGIASVLKVKTASCFEKFPRIYTAFHLIFAENEFQHVKTNIAETSETILYAYIRTTSTVLHSNYFDFIGNTSTVKVSQWINQACNKITEKFNFQIQ